ncbi:MAG: TlpA family protein disulfide reductase [Bacteroidales bacterium]|nr:TlpA family protein disulfide reductase [Bacteroidales bacterium]
MENRKKTLQIGFMAAGILIGVASFFYGLFGSEYKAPTFMMNWCAGAGICLALSIVVAPKRPKHIWLCLLSLLVLVSVPLYINSVVKSAAFRFVGIIAACLFVPYLLTIIILRLPVKDVYKESLFMGFLPFAVLLLTGAWGNDVVVMSIAFVTLPAFYYVTRNATTKERWIRALVFILPMVLSHIIGYFPYVAARLIALVMSVLAVILLQSLKVSTKTRNVFLAVLMLFSLPLSFLMSANLFAYLVANEMNSKVDEPFPLSYAFVTNEGDTLTEASLKGKNVAVFFWSSHCGNCHRELPHFSKLAAQYEGDTTKVFVAAFVSFNEESDSAFYAYETQNESAHTWAKVVDSKAIMQDLDFNAFPQLTYINKEGKVVYNGYLSNRPWIFAYSPRKFLK